VIRSFASEWIKLRRRGMLYAAALVAAAATLATSLRIATADSGSDRGLRGGPTLTPDTLADADGFAQALGTASTIIGAVMLAIFAFAVASEFSQGTLRNLLVREPRRARLVAGKLLALASFAAAAIAAATLVALVGATISAASSGIDSSGWFTGTGLTETVKAAGELIAASLGFGVLGAALGLVLRAPTSAIGSGLAYVLPVESLLAAAWGGADRWLPGQLLEALAEGGNGSVSFARAALLLCAYTSVALVAATASFVRRDVTA
jgi:ABC-2 type transport system permease protein